MGSTKKTLRELSIIDNFLMDAVASDETMAEDFCRELVSKLPNLYIISILDFDPFGYDYMQYSVHNTCDEVSELEYEDGLHYYYFYPNGKKGGSKEIRNLLRYILDSREENAVDEATKKIHQYIEKIRNNPGMEEAYMTWGEYIDEQMEVVAEEVTKDVTEKVTKEVTEAVSRRHIYDVLEDLGEITEAIKEKVDSESDEATLKKWLKLAARATTIQEFEEKM